MSGKGKLPIDELCLVTVDLACSELGVRPDEAVYLGDNPVADIEGARGAGLRTIFIPSTTYPHCAIANASCDDMSRLPQILNDLCEK